MKFRLVIAIALIPQIFVVNYLKNSPSIIDKYYTIYLYNFISEANSFIFSGIDFPIGEILYLVIIVTILYFLYKAFSFKLNDLTNLFSLISIIYFLFYSLWGLNYFRTSISEILNIKSDYKFVELDYAIDEIINKIEEETLLIEKNKDNKSVSNIFELTNTINSNIKKSILPDIFLYQKVSGHYIPFTSEAIIVEEIPIVDIPIVIYHEQAHQNGFADEAEASFIAFYKSINNKNSFIRYSGYFNALLNLLNEVTINHPEKLEYYMSKLNNKVRLDIKNVQNFWSKYSDNFFDKIGNYIYDFYLKSNSQESGILTYKKVSIYIIDYYQRDRLSNFFN